MVTNVSYPKVIPKGTLIHFGEKPGRQKRAYGLVAQIVKDAQYEADGVYHYTWHSIVIENPNGWHLGDISHKINLHYDTIINSSNSDSKYVLERFDDD